MQESLVPVEDPLGIMPLESDRVKKDVLVPEAIKTDIAKKELRTKDVFAFESTKENIEKGFEKATVTQANPTMEGMFTTIDPDLLEAPALSGAMGLSSSLNLFGLFSEKETRIDDAGNLIEVVDAPNSDRNKWVISPRMETPVLDFSTQPEQMGWGRGMWSGYGNILTSSNGITFGVEETYKGGSILQNANTGSLLQKCFTNPRGS